MTRIGFAYNQKPEQPARIGNKATAHQNSVEDGELSRLQNEFSADDEFAEWDSKETIDAVAKALSALGEVIRLEADDDFPERLRRVRPDIVFNIAEGKNGVNREAHVPRSASFTASLSEYPLTLPCASTSSTKSVVTQASDRALRIRDRRRARATSHSSFPLRQPIHEGSSRESRAEFLPTKASWKPR